MYLSAVETLQRMLLAGLPLAGTLMGLEEAGVGELDIRQETLAPIQLAFL